MIVTQVVKAVIKRVIVVMIIPNLTKKKGRIPSMKLIKMKRVFESDQEENEKEVEDDEEEKDDEFVKTPSNSTDDEDETNVEDKSEGDEDKGMDYTTNQFDDDVDVRLNEPVNTDEGFITKEGIDAEMTNKTEVPVTSSSYSSDLTSKFLKFSNIPHKDAEILSLNLHLYSPLVTALEKEVAERKKDDLLNTQVTDLVDEHLDSRLGSTRDEFMSYLSASIPARITEQVKIQLPQILPKEVSKFAPSVIKSMRSQKDKDKDADPSARSDRGLKKRKTSKDVEPTKEPTDLDWNVGKTPQQGPTQSWLITLASSADKPSKTFDELMSTPIDFSAYIMNGQKITNLTQETLLGPAFKHLKGTRTNFAELEYDFKECFKALSKKLNWDNPEGGDYLFDLTKPLPLVINGNRQIVLVDYFFNNDINYLQGGISTMTYTNSITKTKAAQYDLPGIEDTVPNIWSHVKVTYDKHAIWGISYWRDQRKTFYGYARGLESSHDVYSTKCILEVTRVENKLTNLFGNDVSDFAISLRMFTRSMVIQKRVEDLQLGVKSYQKKINITKPETTRLDIRKRDPYTPYQEP
ncbi:hypothetical protein Tco_1492184 [Tanacetum coccineum]